MVHISSSAPHSPLLYTTIPDTLIVSGDGAELLVLRAELTLSGIPLHLDAADGSSPMRISGIRPGDLHRTLSLVEKRVTDARLLPGQKRVVSRVDDRPLRMGTRASCRGGCKTELLLPM